MEPLYVGVHALRVLRIADWNDSPFGRGVDFRAGPALGETLHYTVSLCV